MIEFGKTLGAAREAKGYSVGQLAELTRMAPKTILELESENFTHIAAPIYGRGFVKLYCEAVGIDPKPLVDEFMEIYNGNRQPEIRERPLRNEPNDAGGPEDSVEPTVSAVMPPGAAADELPAPVDAAEPPPVRTIAQPILNPEPKPEPDLFRRPETEDPVPEPSLSRYAAPIREACPAFDPKALVRIGILAVGALLLLALLAWGVRAVYRATTRSGEETRAPVSAPAAPAAKTDKPAAPTAKTIDKPTAATGRVPARTPQKIPSLYID